MLTKLLESSSLQAFYREVQTSSSLLIEHLWDTPKMLLTLLAQKATGKNILILSGKKEDRFLESFPFFLGKEIIDFPPWETLPNENVPPSSDISGRRLEILYQITQKQEPLIVHSPLQGLLQKTISPKELSPLCKVLRKGEDTPFTELTELLEKLGYKRRPVAADKGEFAVRGGIIDIFPTASFDPYRIDFFGDTIETIRTYDPIGQKSLTQVDSLFLCPASEWSLLKEAKELVTLLDYMGPNTLLILDDLLAIENEYVALKSLPGMQGRAFFSLDELIKKLPDYTHLFFVDQKIEELSSVHLKDKKGREFYSGKTPFQSITFDFFTAPFSSLRFHHPFVEIMQFFSRFESQSAATKEEILLGIHHHHNLPIDLHFVVNGPAEECMILEKAKELDVTFPKKTQFHTGYLPSGFILQDSLLTFLPTPEFTHRYKVRRQKWRNSYHSTSSEFHQLMPGDTIVHLHHGIGKFLGVETKKNHLGQEAEFFRIEYSDNSALYVPIAHSHFITPYIGSHEERPTFSVLGTKKWQKIYADAQKSILGYAQDLLQNTAKRTVAAGFCFPKDSTYMQMFEEEFPFSETEDQLRAIAEFKLDMSSDKAMDRLICGDVGYGKTEVALRAAFKAAFDGKKQVAVLVPTTLLAMQHYETFKARMANFPLSIALLSRFSSAKKTRETLEELKNGSIDIVIGTHRLISKDIAFKDLGLLIIDEEQRFGVRAKEHIKSLKTGVDCLTLSATPIPRTLYMSLIGIREVSVINTPPHDRLPIKSIVIEKDQAVIEQAILREFAREGQVFFIHNRIETLPKVYHDLQKLIPSAKIVMGHGQMGSDEIEAVFSSFKSGEADILLSTTIVENGIDISNANTIFIDRADQFGMADLYQLRGRVGRWNRTAYAYFLTPKNQCLSELAQKRLRTLADSSGYGSGMKIALRDLELRGAGDILGTQQSGQISAVGFHLYCKMLKKAVEALKNQKPLQLTDTKLEFTTEAKLPADYVNEPSLRMEFYYRLGNASSSEEVDEILAELQDRFGKAPKEALLLCLFSRIKVEASSLHITCIKFDRFTMQVEKQLKDTTVKQIFSIPSPFPQIKAFEQKVVQTLKEWKPKK
ncbi:MAG: transcription-repair coupling factor [Chlamydiota bacterium]